MAVGVGARSDAGGPGVRFRSLRALRVTRFDQRVDSSPFAPAKRGGDWRVAVVADHCLVERDCASDVAIFDTLWRVTSTGLRLSGLRTHDPASACRTCGLQTSIPARPWESTELAARVGRRTVVAVPIAHRARLADLSRRAEAAAVTADRYTVGAGRVDRYRVFLADAASWKRWYSDPPGGWVAGRAVPTGPQRMEVAVLARHMTPDYADELLRHELAHVSTLRTDSHYGRNDVWWLVEGMADYVQQDGGSADDSAERYDLRRFLRSHRLRSVQVTPPAADASPSDAAGRYAVGYFALRHLITRYGRPAALKFFEQAVQQGVGLDTAARSALGVPWAKVDRQCVAAVNGV